LSFYFYFYTVLRLDEKDVSLLYKAMDYSKKAYDEAIAAKDEAMAAKDAAIRSENAIKEFLKNYNASEVDSSNNDGDGDVKKQGKKVYWYSVSIMFIEFIYVYYVYQIDLYFSLIIIMHDFDLENFG